MKAINSRFGRTRRVGGTASVVIIVFVDCRFVANFGRYQLMEPFQVGQRDPVIRHQTQGQLVIVFRFPPLALDVQQRSQIAINCHILHNSFSAKFEIK